MEYQFRDRYPQDWFIQKSKEQIIKQKDNRYQMIKNYFKNDNDKLLCWNLIEDESPWKTLVSFLQLDISIPSLGQFPYANRNPNR